MRTAHRDAHPVRIRNVDVRSMEDATQLDLVDYISDDSGDDDTQSRVSCPSEAGCVHTEHGPFGSGETLRVHAEHTDAALPVMSPRRLLVCLVVLGWSERELARRLGRHQTTIRRWVDGGSAVDREVAAWLEALADFHARHPAPRAAGGTGSRSASLIPVLLPNVE